MTNYLVINYAEDSRIVGVVPMQCNHHQQAFSWGKDFSRYFKGTYEVIYKDVGGTWRILRDRGPKDDT